MANNETDMLVLKQKKIGSWLLFRILAVMVLFLGLCFITVFPEDDPIDDESIENFVSNTVQQWGKKYKDDPYLKVARIEINFRKDLKNFEEGEGTVIAPVGIDLYGAQKILEVASYPSSLRPLSVDGIKCLSWEYPGKVNKDLRYVALTLVRCYHKNNHTPSPSPTYKSLPPGLLNDAMVTATELEEHSLHECAYFDEWVKKVAGKPPYTDQFIRIVKTVGSNIIKDKKKDAPDDICAAIREKRYSLHRAHVISVMAARQLKIPSFGFAPATHENKCLVGIYTDQSGWLFIDIENYEKGYIKDLPVLLTKTPLITPFEGSRHDFWHPEAAAYHSGYYGISWFSCTNWLNRQKDPDKIDDTTEATTVLLSEMCK